jgi:hypothetical protein
VCLLVGIGRWVSDRECGRLGAGIWALELTCAVGYSVPFVFFLVVGLRLNFEARPVGFGCMVHWEPEIQW